jgi:hypothetical protein
VPTDLATSMNTSLKRTFAYTCDLCVRVCMRAFSRVCITKMHCLFAYAYVCGCECECSGEVVGALFDYLGNSMHLILAACC